MHWQKILVFLLGLLVSNVQCQTGTSYIECVENEFAKREQALFIQLQRALLDNPGNLYTLRNAFFPPGSREPLVVAVGYFVSFTYSDNMTSNSSPCTNNTTGMNDTITAENIFVRINYAWTGSAVFAVIDPYVLELLQPAVLYTLNPVTSSFYGNRGTDADVFLEVNNLNFVPQFEEVFASLNEITTLLKSYANRQGELEDWYSDYPRGFTTVTVGDNLAYAAFYPISVLLLVVAVLALVRLLYISELLQNYLRRALNGEKPHSVLLASVYIAAAIVNLGFFVSETNGTVRWLSIGSEQTDNTVNLTVPQAQATVLSKYLMYTISCAIAFCLAIHLANKSEYTANLPKQIKVIAMFFSCGCLFFWWIGYCKHNIQQNIYKTLIAWNFLMLFVILSWNLFPILVLILAKPVVTIAVLSIIVSYFFMIIFGVSISLAYPAHKCINISLSVIVGIVVAIVLILFLALIRVGFGTGGTLEALVTFGPVIIAGGIAWLSNKFLENFATDGEESDQDNPEVDNENKSDTAIELDYCLLPN